MPALHRAVALKQIHIIALGISKHLNFDMARPLQIFFNQHAIVAEAVNGLALARSQCRFKVFATLNDTHTLTATTCAGF